jgi:hypothetical protein
MVVPMALRLCQGVERDCFVHNSTTTWTRLGSALACRHFSFFLFIRFSTFSLCLSLVPVAVCTASISAQRRACRVCSGGSFGHGIQNVGKLRIRKKRTWGRSMGHANGRETHRQAQQERERKEILKERARACVHLDGTWKKNREREREREKCIYLNVCVSGCVSVCLSVCECR